MTLDQLRTFQAVAAANSFRRAAEVLHLTQPAISKQIQALEAELDQRLFERGRSSRLTLAGSALLKHVGHLSRILTTAKEEIADLKELRGGHISIGAAHSIATHILPNLIETYRSRYPKVNLSIEAAWSAEIMSRVAAYDLDLGLLVRVSPKLEGLPQLRFVPLARTDLVFVTSPNNPMTKKKSITWDDLAEAPWILNQEGCVYRGYIESKLRERGQAMKVEVEVIGLELQKKLTQLGLGVSLLPKDFVLTEVQRGDLRALKVKGTKIQNYWCLVFRNDKYLHGAMKAFLKLLGETFAPAKTALGKHVGAELTSSWP
ncbi:MAG: LysR family transcriptional regulator [Candidatus Binatia bacterium]